MGRFIMLTGWVSGLDDIVKDAAKADDFAQTNFIFYFAIHFTIDSR